MWDAIYVEPFGDLTRTDQMRADRGNLLEPR